MTITFIFSRLEDNPGQPFDSRDLTPIGKIGQSIKPKCPPEIHTDIYILIHIYMHVCMHTYIHARVHAYIYMHVCVHTYIHACKHACIMHWDFSVITLTK